MGPPRESLSVFGTQLLNEFLQRSQLPPVDQVEFLHKEDKVLEGGVEVCLLLQPHDGIEVLVVNVGIHTEESLQDGLGHRHEVVGKRDTDL